MLLCEDAFLSCRVTCILIHLSFVVLFRFDCDFKVSNRWTLRLWSVLIRTWLRTWTVECVGAIMVTLVTHLFWEAWHRHLPVCCLFWRWLWIRFILCLRNFHRLSCSLVWVTTSVVFKQLFIFHFDVLSIVDNLEYVLKARHLNLILIYDIFIFIFSGALLQFNRPCFRHSWLIPWLSWHQHLPFSLRYFDRFVW